MRDMFNSAETYIEMWERVEGVRGPTLHQAAGDPAGRRPRAARHAGGSACSVAPASRRSGPGVSFRWCGRTRAAFVGGKVALVGRKGAKAPAKRGKRIAPGLRKSGRHVVRGKRAVAVTKVKAPRRVIKLMKRAGL